MKASTAQVTGGEDNHPKIVDHAADIEAFKALAGESNTELLEKLLAQIVGGNLEAVNPVLLSPDSDKSHRAASDLLLPLIKQYLACTSGLREWGRPELHCVYPAYFVISLIQFHSYV